MPEYQKTYDDWNKYYGGCFGVLNGKIPVITDKCNGERIKFDTVTLDEDCNRKTIAFDEKWKDKLDMSPLQVGAINLASSVLVLENRTNIPSPWKYKYASSDYSTTWFDPFTDEREYLRSPQVERLNDPHILEYWVNNTYLEPMEALESVLSFKRLAAAFSSRYYFGIQYSTNNVCIFRDRLIVGHINKDREILLREKSHPLYESLSEYGFTVRKIQ